MKEKNIKNKEINTMETLLKKQINQTYKKPFWEKVENFLGVFFIAIFLLICIIIILILGITLIENPLSLAILCGTIFLIMMWWNK